MKPIKRLFAAGLLCASACVGAYSDNLVILHTNDTHSQIDPNDKGQGGILRRKVLIDSVRAAEPNVLLIDAGDAVQGTLYFTLYKGEVERKMMNALGYDIQVLGNHEFDNGVESLAEQWSGLNADKITSNYDLRGTALEGLFKPYAVRKIGGKTVGFLAINLDPAGMIACDKSEGVIYLDGIKAANSMAWYLRNVEHADVVVAITHVGYETENPPTPGDVDIAGSSEDIDVIIGGHSHTLIDPASVNAPQWLVANAKGDSVLVVQTGSRGVNLGLIDIDLDTKSKTYRLLPVDSRLDDRIDPVASAILEPYRAGVDSLMNVKVGRMAQEMPHGSQLILNWVADAMFDMGADFSDRPIDLAIVNKGGIRRGLPKGDITKGMIMTMLPFDNRLVVMDIKGSDLAGAFAVMAHRGGDGFSADFDYKNIDTDRTYRLVTIDYLANGGDYMEPLTHGTVLANSHLRLDETLMKYLEQNKKKSIKYNDGKPRM
ncbi:MAG: bifunctional metallophosphatase/5'-nucleotidase [Muribaculum sp.]|nr:bifunctional metallophosphatase/5'-nucleotidase [Muribaculum sp.]